jgi:2-keto-3-deoxy-L-rhamnonate aldolase RhmA
VAQAIGWTGFDVIWLDMEHRSFDYALLDPLSLVCRHTGIHLMAAHLEDRYTAPMRTLEFGANGLMNPPRVNVAEARQWVEWTKFSRSANAASTAHQAGKDFFDSRELAEKTFWHYAGHSIGHHGHEAFRIIPGSGEPLRPET